MRQLHQIVLIALAAMAISAAPATTTPETDDPVINDASLREQAWTLFSLAKHGQSRIERAAFVERDGEGHLFLEIWVAGTAPSRVSFEGPIPPRAIAIIHTHPNDIPFPSVKDQYVARRLGMPVYVVTRRLIARTDGKSVESIWCGVWNPGTRNPHSRCPHRPKGHGRVSE